MVVPSDAARAKVKKFVETYVRKGPYALYPDAAVTDNVVEGLADNLEQHGKMYCPCTPIDECIAQGSAMVCPCTPHKSDIERQGYCDCALFASRDFVAAENLKKQGK